MALFIDKNKRRKSPLTLLCFVLSLLYMVIYGITYALLTEPLYRHVVLGSAATTNLAHAVIMALVGTAVCCLTFLLPDKRVAPGAYVSLTVLLAVFYLTVSMLSHENRAIMLELITLYGFAPVIVGNLAAWPIYWKLQGAHAPVQIKTLREEVREAQKQAAEKAAKKAAKQGSRAARAAAPTPPPPAPTPAETPELFFGPEADRTPGVSHSAEEEAMLFYADEENDD